MKDNKQLSTQMYRKPWIEFVHVRQEQILLTNSDDDGPIVIVTPENANRASETEAEGVQADISVIPPTENAPENLWWH